MEKDVKDPWYSLIATGVKTIEGRLDKGGFFSNLKVGDKIVFTNDELKFRRRCNVIVTKINRYNDFETYLCEEGLHKCLPTVDTIENGIHVYEDIYTNKEEVKKYMVVAIHMLLS